MYSPPQLIEQQLAAFDSHGLADLNRANLQNRVDSKFVLPMACLPMLLQAASNHYSVLEISGKRAANYFNQYFDTHEMRFYHDHHNGKLNRYKVRKRTYMDTQTRFLEVKFKNNRKRTIKHRLCCTEQVCAEDYQGFVQHHSGVSFALLKVIQQGGYRRIALANEAIPERLTLDYNLWYQPASGGQPIQLNGFFIAELKQPKRAKNSPFYQLLPQNLLRPTSFSKYCIGCALLYQQELKYNRFKPTLMKLNALSQSNPHTAPWSH